MKLNATVDAPIPMASDAIATALKTGAFRIRRRP